MFHGLGFPVRPPAFFNKGTVQHLFPSLSIGLTLHFINGGKRITLTRRGLANNIFSRFWSSLHSVNVVLFLACFSFRIFRLFLVRSINLPPLPVTLMETRSSFAWAGIPVAQACFVDLLWWFRFQLSIRQGFFRRNWLYFGFSSFFSHLIFSQFFVMSQIRRTFGLLYYPGPLSQRCSAWSCPGFFSTWVSPSRGGIGVWVRLEIPTPPRPVGPDWRPSKN